MFCFIWIFELFGPYLTEAEERLVLGVALALPAILAFGYGLRSLGADDPPASR